MNGSPATGTSALGIVALIAPSRVARPPARIATGSMGSDMLLRDHLGALEIEVEAHLLQAGLAHGGAQAHPVLGVEHQEAAAAGPDQLAADRAVAHGEIVAGVDARVRHAARALALVLPMLVHEPAEPGKVARLERRLGAHAEILH